MFILVLYWNSGCVGGLVSSTLLSALRILSQYKLDTR